MGIKMLERKKKSELIDIIKTQEIYLKADKEYVEWQRNYIKKLEQKIEKDKLGFRYTTFVYCGLIWWCVYLVEKSILWWIEFISWF